MKNNLTQKGFIVPVLIVIIALLVIGGGVYIYKNKKVEAPVVVNENEEIGLDNQQEIAPIDTTVKDTNTKTFKLGTLEFSYPSNLSYSSSGGIPVISLNHSIPFKHVNSCDLKDGLSLDDAADFSSSFKLYNTNIINSIKKDNPNGYTDMIKNGVLSIQTGFVDKYKIGSLDGYKITVGVEGCGYSTYYFPISVGETLVVRRDFYLQTLQMGREKLINMPGFITSTQEESIFQSILSSVTGLENQKTISVKVYFGDTIDAQSCHTSSYVERIIPETTAIARASLNELLKGPTAEEKLQDRWTGLNSGISIKTLTINNGIAYVDFSLSPATSTFNAPNRGTCGASIVKNQIENTLKQFSTIKSVVIKVNGQPMENFIDP